MKHQLPLDISKLDLNVIKTKFPAFYGQFEFFMDEVDPMYKVLRSPAQNKTSFVIFVGGMQAANAVTESMKDVFPDKATRKLQKKKYYEEFDQLVGYLDEVTEPGRQAPKPSHAVDSLREGIAKAIESMSKGQSGLLFTSSLFKPGTPNT